jgi:hypothetical protein
LAGQEQKNESKIGKIFFFGSVLISQLIIPIFNQNSNWLIFSKWTMLANIPEQQSADISWDGGRSFVFRDKYAQMSGNVDLVALYNLVQRGDLEKVRKFHLKDIQTYCGCDGIEVYKLSLDPYDHLSRQSPFNIIARERL